MNTKFRILWIDDSETYYESTEELIEELVYTNSMVPSITFFDIYEDFRSQELERFDIEVFNRYDLLIIDYALSGMTGIDIINELRNKQIYTDIVFYSSEPATMKEEVQKCELLDGVFFADRKDLTSVVNNVIKKNIRREYNIANIRGLIMDNTSEFDYICRITTTALFEKLSPEDQSEVETKLREFVAKANTSATKNFTDLDKKTGPKYISTAMNSTDYVMNNADRYTILSLILQKIDFEEQVPTDFHTHYTEDVIKARNKLAHSMLYYGNCQKKIHISKIRESLNCGSNCTDCKAAYDILACETLRKKLFEYRRMFAHINDQTSKYLQDSEN